MSGSNAGLNRRVVVRAGVLALLVFTATLVNTGSAQAVACFGPPVTTSITLTASILNCADNGIEVGANGITIRLNGFTIDGDNVDDGNDFGIDVGLFDNVKILGPGTIQQFHTGVRAADLTLNTDGAYSGTVNGLQVKNVTITDNTGDSTGITVFNSRGTVISGNTVTSNDGTGIALYGNTYSATVSSNTVTGNGADGIFAVSEGESTNIEGASQSSDLRDHFRFESIKILNNTVTGNAGTGIVVDTDGGALLTISGNNASGNGTSTGADVGHEERAGGGDVGGSGIKVGGAAVSGVKILNNQANNNGGAGTCGQRNGAGIMVIGAQFNTLVKDNTANGNALGGIFWGGHMDRSYTNNNIVQNNVLEGCDIDDGGGIQYHGVFSNVQVQQNNVTGNNGAFGIGMTGRFSSTVISGNNASNNDPTAGGETQCSFDPGFTMCTPFAPEQQIGGIVIEGWLGGIKILGNTASGNDSLVAPSSPHPDAHGISVSGRFTDLLVQNNNANGNGEDGIGVRGEGFNTRLFMNNTVNNGDDGIDAITNWKAQSNTASGNGDIQISHTVDPTVRGGDPQDGPHFVTNLGGNSPGITIT